MAEACRTGSFRRVAAEPKIGKCVLEMDERIEEVSHNLIVEEMDLYNEICLVWVESSRSINCECSFRNQCSGCNSLCKVGSVIATSRILMAL